MSLAGDIRTACVDAGLEVREDLHTLLAVHLEAVLEVNKRMNLTAITEVDEAIALHVVDSLLTGDELKAAPDGRFADIGSGAGYPGIPLALLTGRSVDLVESVTKKASFLREVIVLLGKGSQLNVVNARAEVLAAQSPGVYSAVTARAVSSLPSLVELASPLLMPSGRLIALKGRVSPEELKAGEEVAGIAGMRVVGMREYSLLGRGDQRACLVYEKVSGSSVRLPRREGLAQRRPLA